MNRSLRGNFFTDPAQCYVSSVEDPLGIPKGLAPLVPLEEPAGRLAEGKPYTSDDGLSFTRSYQSLW